MTIDVDYRDDLDISLHCCITIHEDEYGEAFIWNYALGFIKALRVKGFTDEQIDKLFTLGVDHIYDRAYDID